jgi:membrane protein DedA with SNARE-associated domain
MDVIAVAGLAALILVKEAGIPIPIPGDLLVIGAGATLAGNLPAAGSVLAVLLLAGFIGATVQFLLLRGALRRPILKALARLGISEERIRGLADRFSSGGFGSIGLTRMTPGLRIAVIPAAAIAGIPYLVFLAGIVIGNGVFVTAHFGLGFALGAYAQDLVMRFGGIVLGIVVLVLLAIGGWLVVRSRRRAAHETDAYECWADCSCPACVLIVARAGR